MNVYWHCEWGNSNSEWDFSKKKKESVSHAGTMALSFSNDTTSMHNHVMYLWILCVFWMNGCSFILSNRKRHYTQFCLLRDHLNNVGSYIIISFIHYWLVEWFCSYYRGITLHYMKPLIYRAGFGTTLCVFSKEEAIISRAEIHSP